LWIADVGFYTRAQFLFGSTSSLVDKIFCWEAGSLQVEPNKKQFLITNTGFDSS
jgi:hypothetical protein